MTSQSPCLTPDTVATAFLDACRDELSALKPGNVHIHGDGHDMTVADFEAAAVAAAGCIAAPGLGVGQRIENAINASFEATGCNTNLGIILLSAPLASASIEPYASCGLRDRLKLILTHLDLADAEHAFAAIARANPGGLGDSSQHDVHTSPGVTLREAMRAAADRDRIANAYSDDFEDIFAFGLPAFRAAKKNANSSSLAISTLHMAYLAKFPDTHITRKYGNRHSQGRPTAGSGTEPLLATAVTKEKFCNLLAFDVELKADGLNPGTTARFCRRNAVCPQTSRRS